jgi:CO/xanthine dehydrogenase FAD-binding subunit
VYLRPRTLHEAVDALGEPGAQVLAGGTDFYPALGERWISTPVVDITAVKEIKGIAREKNEFRIGGGTTWTEILRTPLPRCFDALKSAAREIGGVQIQNRGTVAGNLCNASPAADSVPPLLALDAQVELVSTSGLRRVPLADFIVGNRKTLRTAGEILTAVIVPRTADDASSAFLKLGARRYLVISIAMVAAVVALDERRKVRDACIAVGSCSVRAQRLSSLERALMGAPVGAGLGAIARPEHLEPLTSIDDVRATAAYRHNAALTLVRRALDLCAGSC